MRYHVRQPVSRRRIRQIMLRDLLTLIFTHNPMRYHVRQARQFSSRLWPGLMVTSVSMTTCGRTGDSPFWAHFRDQTNPL